MSLDIYFYDLPREVKCICDCGHEHMDMKFPLLFHANITHNCGPMAEEAGIYKVMWRPEEIGITQPKEMIPILEEGILNLESEPLHFKGFNPDNGYGSYEGLLRVASELLKACKEFPYADLEVSI